MFRLFAILAALFFVMPVQGQELLKKIEDISGEVKVLQRENETLRSENTVLRKTIHELRKTVALEPGLPQKIAEPPAADDNPLAPRRPSEIGAKQVVPPEIKMGTVQFINTWKGGTLNVVLNGKEHQLPKGTTDFKIAAGKFTYQVKEVDETEKEAVLAPGETWKYTIYTYTFPQQTIPVTPTPQPQLQPQPNPNLQNNGIRRRY